MMSLARSGLVWVASLVLLVTFLTLQSTHQAKAATPTPTTNTGTTFSPLRGAWLRQGYIIIGDEKVSRKLCAANKDDYDLKIEDMKKEIVWKESTGTFKDQQSKQLRRLAMDKKAYTSWVREWRGRRGRRGGEEATLVW